VTEITGQSSVPRESTTELIMRVFLRMIAAYCLLFGFLYWVRLVGYYDDPLWRFDLMPVHWQVASVTLAVFFPIAAIGLWGLTSWGPVIWFICAAVETVMYAGFPDLFGSRPQVVLSHALVALFYLALRVLLHLQRRKAEERI